MTERPILFNGTMVRAILSGAKTVTRRVCREMPTAPGLHDLVGGYAWNGNVESPALVKYDERGVSVWPFRASRCGGVGDRLYVRETWCSADYWTTGRSPDPPEHIRYAADNSALDHTSAPPRRLDTRDWSDPKRWRPSIHMPRWASRLSLDVVSVGIERLQDITEDDARREGIEPVNGGWGLAGESWSCGSARGAFQTLWDLIGGDGAWRVNPWVWRVEFERAPTLAADGAGVSRDDGGRR
jgi:hypothetical protein